MIFARAKLIYVPIPKTGTVSMATWLRQFMSEDFRTTEEQAEEFGHPNHPTLLQCHQKLLFCGEDPREYRSFSFVRNPWDHMYSMWVYLVKTRLYDGSWSDWMNAVENDYENTDMWKTHRFKGFLDRLESPYRNIDYVGTLEEYDKHVRVLKELILDKRIQEYIQDARRDHPWFASVNTPSRLANPDHLNRSSTDKNEWKEKYTPHQKQIIADLYAEDINRFEYTFN